MVIPRGVNRLLNALIVVGVAWAVYEEIKVINRIRARRTRARELAEDIATHNEVQRTYGAGEYSDYLKRFCAPLDYTITQIRLARRTTDEITTLKSHSQMARLSDEEAAIALARAIVFMEFRDDFGTVFGISEIVFNMRMGRYIHLKDSGALFDYQKPMVTYEDLLNMLAHTRRAMVNLKTHPVIIRLNHHKQMILAIFKAQHAAEHKVA